MFGLVSGLVKVAVKTAVVLPVAVVMDVATFGGDLSDKRTSQSYSGDVIDSINNDFREICDD